MLQYFIIIVAMEDVMQEYMLSWPHLNRNLTDTSEPLIPSFAIAWS